MKHPLRFGSSCQLAAIDAQQVQIFLLLCPNRWLPS
jgi:hypothetical protein